MEIQNKFEFWRLQRLIVNQSTLSYRVISIWKDLRCIMSFSLTFYAENLQKRQITVLGYKKGSKIQSDKIFWSETSKLCVVSFATFVSKWPEHWYSLGGCFPQENTPPSGLKSVTFKRKRLVRLAYCDFIKAFITFLSPENEDFWSLQSNYMTIIIS